MTDAKNLLEDQLEASHRRIASVHDLENSLARSEQRLRDMTAVGLTAVYTVDPLDRSLSSVYSKQPNLGLKQEFCWVCAQLICQDKVCDRKLMVN